jgi:hypothetical protein
VENEHELIDCGTQSQTTRVMSFDFKQVQSRLTIGWLVFRLHLKLPRDEQSPHKLANTEIGLSTFRVRRFV